MRCAGWCRPAWGSAVSEPLAGIRVIEIGTLIAAPFAARLLAEFGAEVIKIEAPNDGDPLRRWRMLHEGTSLWWYLQSRNKKSVCVDLKSPDGVEVDQAARAQRRHLHRESPPRRARKTRPRLGRTA